MLSTLSSAAGSASSQAVRQLAHGASRLSSAAACAATSSAPGRRENRRGGARWPRALDPTALRRPPAAAAFSTLTVDTLPRKVLECSYAVRGAVMHKAEEIQKRLLVPDEKDKLPFDRIVPCNIGNPQAVGQAPLTFHRQVLACLSDPALATRADVFPEDVRERAARYLEGLHDGRVGAYSHSKGTFMFRQDIASWLTHRDGCEADPEHVFLTDGASAAVKMVMQLLIRGKEDGVLLPIPQYPLYSATMTLLGGKAVGYYLEEEDGWSIRLEELERAVSEFKQGGGKPRAIVVINPGNPTGQVLTREAMEAVLRFAEREGLVLLADEVYQDNIHVDGKDFIPFRRLARELGIDKIEIFSFHSVSKGVTGECGLRGGLVHCQNVHPKVMEQMYKLASISLCSNVLGQALMASVVTPPPRDGPSWAEFDREVNEVHDAMYRKAKRVTERLNAIEGIECQPIEGAMYAFPKVCIKGYVMKKAISLATPADQIYCIEMVERTGIITVPGSGFGQRPGTFHFRMTILPAEPILEQVLDSIEKFHNEHAGGWFA